MPKGYWIVHVDVRDAEAYQHTSRPMRPRSPNSAARFLVRGGSMSSPRAKRRRATS